MGYRFLQYYFCVLTHWQTEGLSSPPSSSTNICYDIPRLSVAEEATLPLCEMLSTESWEKLQSSPSISILKYNKINKHCIFITHNNRTWTLLQMFCPMTTEVLGNGQALSCCLLWWVTLCVLSCIRISIYLFWYVKPFTKIHRGTYQLIILTKVGHIVHWITIKNKCYFYC